MKYTDFISKHNRADAPWWYLNTAQVAKAENVNGSLIKLKKELTERWNDPDLHSRYKVYRDTLFWSMKAAQHVRAQYSEWLKYVKPDPKYLPLLKLTPEASLYVAAILATDLIDSEHLKLYDDLPPVWIP